MQKSTNRDRNYPLGIPSGFPCRPAPRINIVHKLHRRQTHITSPLEAYHLERSFYQCLVPNHTVTHVHTPFGYLRKFSPDGNVLIGFSSNQKSLSVYDFHGTGAGHCLYQTDTDPTELKMSIFDSFFKLRFSVHVPNDLNRECSLFTSDCRYVIVGASTPLGDAAFPHMYDIFRNSEGIPPTARSGVCDYSLYMIDLLMGSVSDTLAYRYDKIHLAHNQGLSLCDSTLAVLSVQHQTIHLYNVNHGTFSHLQDIGVFCYPDDELVYNSVNFSNSDEDEDTNSLASQPYHNRWFNSLKHRIICYALKEAEKKCTPQNKQPLIEYYQKFDKLVSLRMWKMQLLTETSLLIKYADEDIVSMKQTDPSSQPAMFVFYDIPSTEVCGFYSNTSPELLELYEEHTDEFRAPVSHPMSRDICSMSNSIHARGLHQKFKQTITSAKFGGRVEATRRLLGQLPVASQCLTSSPYLDLSLFSYDDKWISPVERPKPCGDSDVMFFCRDGGSSSFSLGTALRGNQQPISRRLIAYILHPHEPFIISIQKTTNRGMDYVVSFHFRNTLISDIEEKPTGIKKKMMSAWAKFTSNK